MQNQSDTDLIQFLNTVVCADEVKTAPWESSYISAARGLQPCWA